MVILIVGEIAGFSTVHSFNSPHVLFSQIRNSFKIIYDVVQCYIHYR